LHICATDFIISDNRLLLHQKELEIFKKKDPPILTMEEIEESVGTIEQIVQILKEDKNEAQVNKFYVNYNFI
jgi:dynein heavy chain